MLRNTSIFIPTLVRIKPGALDRLGVYARRNHFLKVIVCHSQELDAALVERVRSSLHAEGIEVLLSTGILSSDFEHAQEIFLSLPAHADAMIAFGGGKALDVAKYVAFLSRIPFISVPTALSNDGFCSPQSSLDYEHKKKSFPAAMPYGVVIDTEVCLKAPKILWWSGIGDLVSKITAVCDWKLAFKKNGTQIDDFSALLSDATVFQFMARPEHDLDGIRLLGTALMLNGIAMEMCGSSRPASGSEHLVSHALDRISATPQMHGIQVGMATYLVSQLQGKGADRIAQLFDDTGFWDVPRATPFNQNDWVEAFRMAPGIKKDFYTILDERDCVPEIIRIIETDPRLAGLFI
ncbi:MAG: iron-containing alcohol dehydrogenase family protein [Verrucomicrobiota bacterium]|nr:iron-containing alcohol dehydrogenase family protein [Verrucomicrobiota bacterium]